MTASAAASSQIVREPSARRHFPTSVGILLGISVCAHLAAVLYGLSGAGLSGALYFGVGQFALSLGLLRLYNGAWIFQDIRLLFVIFMFLYGFSLPMIAVAESLEMSGLPEAAFLYGTGFLGFNLVQWWYKRPWEDVPAESLAFVRPTFANALVIVIVFVGILAYVWLRGIRELLTFDRTQMQWLYSQAWVVAMMLMNGFVMYLFAGWPRLSRSARWLTMVIVAAFILFHLGLGNRHSFLPMFIFLAGIIASRRRAVIGPRTVAIALLTFVVLMLVGVVRQVRSAPWLLRRTDLLIQLAEANEFTMPIQTLTYYATANKPLRYGSTYVAAPSVFIPRVLWPEKPIGISQQFNKDRFGGAIAIGYAYTPLTESFVNFGFVGPFIVISLISLATLSLVKHARDHPIPYFVSFSLLIDFHRGDTTAFLYPLVVILAAFWWMEIISRIDWAPRALEGMWPPLAPAERASED